MIRFDPRRILELFLLSCDKNSKYFTKYGERIADELNMDFQTGEDRQRVFDVLPNVRSKAPRSEDIPHASCWSFTAAPPESKAGSWFAWNLAASTQIPEFSAGKMLYGFHTDGPDAPQDPDDAEFGFDQLESLGRSKTPQEEIRKMPVSWHRRAHVHPHGRTRALYQRPLSFGLWRAWRMAYGPRDWPRDHTPPLHGQWNTFAPRRRNCGIFIHSSFQTAPCVATAALSTVQASVQSLLVCGHLQTHTP